MLSSVAATRSSPDMASPPWKMLLYLTSAVVILLFLSPPASANRFTVGDSQGWNPGVNYTVWANKSKPFYVGDWLVFYYQSGRADVIQVDETAYNKCDSSQPISNYSKGRSYAFQLNHSRTYYFICSYGYCYNGMKVAIKAEPLPPPSPPPSSHHNSAAAISTAVLRLYAGAGAAVVLLLRLI